jgi:hypothetical protein
VRQSFSAEFRPERIQVDVGTPELQNSISEDKLEKQIADSNAVFLSKKNHFTENMGAGDQDSRALVARVNLTCG